MKKSFALLAAAAVICVTVCGCGSTEETSQYQDSSDSSISEPVESSTENSIPDSTVPETTLPPEESSIPETSAPNPGQSTVIPDIRSQIAETAKALVGIDFVLGGASPEEGFDNSGFIYYVLRENGYINCPRSTVEQKTMGTLIKKEELKPGDLVFFVDKSTDDTIGFGGIYVGDDKLIYSPYPGEKVKFADLSGSYWSGSFDCAVRVF